MFCAGKRAVLIVEEGTPDYIEQQINVELRRADIQTRVIGKGPLPVAGEYTSDVLLNGLAGFFSEARPAGIDADAIAARVKDMLAHRPAAADGRRHAAAAPADLLHRLPGAASVLRHQADAARAWRLRTFSADIGCHAFATFAPFSMGNSILGYGMSLASPLQRSRPISRSGQSP